MSKEQLAGKVSEVLGYGRDFATSVVDTIADADVERLCNMKVVLPNDLLNAFDGKALEAKAQADAAETKPAVDETKPSDNETNVAETDPK